MADPLSEQSLGRMAFMRWVRQSGHVQLDWADLSENEKQQWVDKAKREKFVPGDSP